MTEWETVIKHVAHNVEGTFDRYKYRLGERLGGPGPIKIVPYNGYGNTDRLYLKGRVLEDKGETLSRENDAIWNNLLNMYKRLESDEIPYARLLARFQGIEQDIQADEEGLFEVWIDPREPLPSDQLWHEIELELLEPQASRQPIPPRAMGKVLVPPASARFAVISDIDDTVLQTDATHLLRMARHVFMGNARTRLPFPGVAAFYRALYNGVSGNEMNPLFFVSSSPWNLYDLLVEFFHLQDIPSGPVLFLRDWGITEEEILPLHHRTYKAKMIRQMLDFYPNLPFILLGDSGQEDPEVYAEVAKEYADRILAAYIRNVSRDLDRPTAIRKLASEVVQARSTLILAENSLIMAKHAAQQRWISSETLPGIQVDRKKDEAPPTPVEKLLGEPEKPASAPVIVEEKTTKSTQAAVEGGVIEEALEKKEPAEKQTPPPIVVNPQEDKSNQPSEPD
ncbi:MAG TPA: phosphatase domain-containing protein [Anaerolineaceae bacterium]|nr:phosphatase domain-containing protein [Anaerolineaceae bacterium]